jgi:hypothetical protein
MQQWDGLHAMLIYESLEMRESIGDESEPWKLTPQVKGLGSHFLLKVRCSSLVLQPPFTPPSFRVLSEFRG